MYRRRNAFSDRCGQLENSDEVCKGGAAAHRIAQETRLKQDIVVGYNLRRPLRFGPLMTGRTRDSRDQIPYPDMVETGALFDGDTHVCGGPPSLR
jgi:hypothetical protein